MTKDATNAIYLQYVLIGYQLYPGFHKITAYDLGRPFSNDRIMYGAVFTQRFV